MCPLRVVLIFLSATFAGFLLLKGLNSASDELQRPTDASDKSQASLDESSASRSSKVFAAISLGFWTCVDMASGRYLWRNLSALKQSTD